MTDISWSSFALGTVLIALALPCAAQERLFENSNVADQSATISRDRGASLNAYFGKRNRLVQINVRVLASKEPFELRLFEDTKLVVRNVSREEFVPGSWRWIGEIIEPRAQVSPQDGQTLTQEQMSDLEYSVHKIELVIVEDERRPPSNGSSSLDSASPPQTQSFGAGMAAPESSKARLFDSSKDYLIQGEFGVTALGTAYRVVPVKSSPGSHLVIEIDGEKSFVVPERGVTGVESDDNRRKREAYQEYKRQVDRRMEQSE